MTTFPQHPPSPLQPLDWPGLGSRRLRIFVKRDDLLHPHVSGNKWRKLKHNLLKAKELNLRQLVTFGGAYSNHLAAVAAAGQAFGFETVGVVRGEPSANPTLRFAEGCGMRLVFANRLDYRKMEREALLSKLGVPLDDALVLPDGGANCLALIGCQEVLQELREQLGQEPDCIVTACGTGTTLAGLASGLKQGRALGVAVLKGGFLDAEVSRLLAGCGSDLPKGGHEVLDGFHHGGYAKWTPALVTFVNAFREQTGIPLDPIYTGKAFMAALQLAAAGHFAEGETLVLLHTGGLQGIAGFNERFGNIITV